MPRVAGPWVRPDQDVETGDREEEPWRAVRCRAEPVEAISGLFSQVSTLGNNLS